MLSILILFALLGLGVLVVLFGTLTKNRWGINLEPVFCPRCQTPLPGLYELRSLRQAMWGGWKCPVCGCAVDKWGREVPADGPPIIAKLPDEMRSVLRRRRRLAALGCFCSLMLIDWIRTAYAGFPPDWGLTMLFEVFVNIGWTVLIFVGWHFFARSLSTRTKSSDDADGNADHSSCGPRP